MKMIIFALVCTFTFAQLNINPTHQCKEWCYDSSISWDKKCLTNSCKACGECDDVVTILNGGHPLNDQSPFESMYEWVGEGFCYPAGCDDSDLGSSSCAINRANKPSITSDECLATCLDTEWCIGFARNSGWCYIYGKPPMEAPNEWTAQPAEKFDIGFAAGNTWADCYRLTFIWTNFGSSDCPAGFGDMDFQQCSDYTGISDVVQWDDKPYGCLRQPSSFGDDVFNTKLTGIAHEGYQKACAFTPPTMAPTTNPTPSPTTAPTTAPSHAPTLSPTKEPTASPTLPPTLVPTVNPTVEPSNNPTAAPTHNPTYNPTTSLPTDMPTTSSPTEMPTTSSPTNVPTEDPTFSPTWPSNYEAEFELFNNDFGETIAVFGSLEEFLIQCTLAVEEISELACAHAFPHAGSNKIMVKFMGPESVLVQVTDMVMETGLIINGGFSLYPDGWTTVLPTYMPTAAEPTSIPTAAAESTPAPTTAEPTTMMPTAAEPTTMPITTELTTAQIQSSSTITPVILTGPNDQDETYGQDETEANASGEIADGEYFNDTCFFANNGECDVGGVLGMCLEGTDCTDCGNCDEIYTTESSVGSFAFGAVVFMILASL